MHDLEQAKTKCHEILKIETNELPDWGKASNQNFCVPNCILNKILAQTVDLLKRGIRSWNVLDNESWQGFFEANFLIEALIPQNKKEVNLWKWPSVDTNEKCKLHESRRSIIKFILIVIVCNAMVWWSFNALFLKQWSYFLCWLHENKMKWWKLIFSKFFTFDIFCTKY